MRKPKILFLSYGFPQSGSGLGRRVDTFLRSLSEIGKVTFVFRTPRNMQDGGHENVRSLCSQFVPIPFETFGWSNPLYRLLETEFRIAKLIPQALSLKPIYIHSNILVKNRSNFLKKFLDALNWNEYDVIHVNRIFMADVVKDHLERIHRNGVATVLDLDDIESVAVERSLKYSNNRARTIVGQFLDHLDLFRLKRYEKRLIQKFNACIVCSDIDKEKAIGMRLTQNPWVIPNAVDTEFFHPRLNTKNDSNDIIFIGNMSFSPNIDAVQYFAHNVLPSIVRSKPATRFVIVGKRPHDSVVKLSNGTSIVVTGEVPDLRKYYNGSAIVVAPIRFGGGTRVKILEAMSMGKSIVTTPVGVEGIPATDAKDIVIADDDTSFAEKCIDLLNKPEKRNYIGCNARRFVRRYFDKRRISQRIQEYYNTIL